MCWMLGYKHEKVIILPSRDNRVAEGIKIIHLLSSEMLNFSHDMNKGLQLPMFRRGLYGFPQVSKTHSSVLFHGVAMAKSNFNLIHFSDLFFLTHLNKQTNKQTSKKQNLNVVQWQSLHSRHVTTGTS